MNKIDDDNGHEEMKRNSPVSPLCIIMTRIRCSGPFLAGAISNIINAFLYHLSKSISSHC